jgi:nucleoside-diphosphate-sugar epimerase
MTSRDTIAATERSTEEASIASSTRVFIFGVTGRVGRLLATRLRARGVIVSGLTRSSLPDPTLEANGVTTVTGELGVATTEEITAMISDWDVIVFAAGSNAGPQSVTDDIDDAALQRDVGPLPKTPLVDGVRQTLELFRRLRAEGRVDASDLG